MANQPEATTYDAGVYQIETTDPMLGGVGGLVNKPLLNLANRTAYLYQHVTNIESGATVVPGSNPFKALVTVDVSGGANIVLNSTQYNAGVIVFTGAMTASITVQFPANGAWIAVNSSTGAFTVTCTSAGGGSSVVLTQGKQQLIFGDNTNIKQAVTQNSVPNGGTTNQALVKVSANNWDTTWLTIPLLNAANAFTVSQSGPAGTLTFAATVAWDSSAIQVATLNMTGNATLALPTNLVAGRTLILIAKQDVTGGRTLSYASGHKFSGGAPTLSTAANAIDILTGVTDGTSVYWGGILKAFA